MDVCIMSFKRNILFVILFSSVSSFAMTDADLENYKTSISNSCEYIKSSINVAISQNVSLANICRSSITDPNQLAVALNHSQYIEEQSLLAINQVNHILDVLSFMGSSQSGGCNWSVEDVLSVLSDLSDIVSYVEQISYDMYTSPNSVYNAINSNGTMINNIIATGFNNVQTTITSMNSKMSGIRNDMVNLKDDLSSIDTNIADIESYQSSINSSVATISSYVYAIDTSLSSLTLITSYLINISSDVSLIATNSTSSLQYLISQLNVLSNRLFTAGNVVNTYYTYKLRDITGAVHTGINNRPYSNVPYFNSANLYDIIAGGFSSMLSQQSSINNYLYYLEKLVVSNNDSRIVAHLQAVSNLVWRLDDYVLNDFSNEFYQLSAFLKHTNVNDSASVSNLQVLAVITQQLYSVDSLLQTNNFLLSEISHISVITNDIGLISTNISFLVDSVRSLELPVTSGYSGDSYYQYLTNLYLSGSAGDNPSSNWFERIEILLSALAFSANSQTNISTTLSDSSSLSQQVERLVDSIDFSQDINNSLDISKNVQNTYLSFFRSLRSVISSKIQNTSFVIGWGDRDTTSFSDLTSGNFRVSVSTSQGVFGNFTNFVRAVTTMLWVLFTLFLIYKTGFWLCSRIYSLYTVVRSLIFSLWGK